MRELAAFLRFVYRVQPSLVVVVAIVRAGRAVVPLAITWTWILIFEQLVRVAAGQVIAHATVWRLLGLEAALAILGAILGRIGFTAMTRLSEQVQSTISIAIMRTASSWPLEMMENPSTLDALERARRQANTSLASFVAAGNVCQESLSIVLFMLVFAWLSPWLVLGLIAVAIPECVSEVYFGQKANDVSRRRAGDRRYLEYLRYLAASGPAAKEVRVFGLAEHLAGRFRGAASTLSKENDALERRRGAIGGTLGAGAIAGEYVTYAAGVAQFLNGQLGVGALMLIVRGLSRVRRNVTRLAESIAVLVQEAPAVRELLAYIGTAETAPARTSGTQGQASDVTDAAHEGVATEALKPALIAGASDTPASTLSALPSRLEFENVSFRYPGAASWALRHVSINFRRGEVTVIVGENGAGKSTLVKLLTRLYEPTEGRLLIDGEDLSRVDRTETRARTSVLFQDFMKYDLRVVDNIAFGRVDSFVDRDRIREAARRGTGEDVIARLPDAYDQMLGRRFGGGVNLSGGQWQRLALARAYVRNGDILVLDEPTASLDIASERQILRQIAAEAVQRVVIVISHRKTTARIADRIVFLSRGVVEEQGTPDELLASGGRYARWFQGPQVGMR